MPTALPSPRYHPSPGTDLHLRRRFVRLARGDANRQEIARLLRFTSTASSNGEQDVSLSGYVARMKEGQEKIYYLLAPSLATAEGSPHLEAFKEKGIDVLLLADGVDEYGMPARPVLEINPQHPLVERLHSDPDEPRLSDWAHVLYNQAVLTLGARIDDPAAFVGQLNGLLVALSSAPNIGQRRLGEPCQ